MNSMVKWWCDVSSMVKWWCGEQHGKVVVCEQHGKVVNSMVKW